MKDKVIIFTVASTIALLLSIPSLNQWANATRDQAAYGGECLLWLMPGLLYMLYATIRDLKETWREER